jgi:anti-anti-sigma regulatory factor
MEPRGAGYQQKEGRQLVREACMLRESKLDVLHSRSDNSEVIICRGVLDQETCGELEAIIDQALDDRVQRLRLDFVGLVTIDEEALRCLRATARRCRESGAVFEVEASGHVRTTIAASGIEELGPTVHP